LRWRRSIGLIWFEDAGIEGQKAGQMGMVDGHLAQLEWGGLVRLAQTAPELEYLFRHALIQDAAYASLLRQDRRRLHILTGEAIETLFPQQLDELAGVLAYHFEHGASWEQALRWLRRAAEQASARWAIFEAIDLYQRALACLPHLPPQQEAEFAASFALAECLMLLGRDLPATIAAFEQALAVAPDGVRRAEAHFRFGQLFHMFTGDDTERAVSHYRQALGLLDEADNPALYARVLAYLGSVLLFRGEVEQSVELVEQALALARRQQLPALLAETLILTGQVYLYARREDEAVQSVQRGLALAESVHDLELVGKANVFLVEAYLKRARQGLGAPEAALPHLRAIQEASRTYHITVMAAMGAIQMGEYAELCGDVPQALQSYLEASQQWAEAGAPEWAAYALACYARLLFQTGEREAANRTIPQIRRLCSPHKAGQAEVFIGWMYAELGQMELAQRHIQQAAALARSTAELRGWLVMFGRGAEAEALFTIPEVAAVLGQGGVGRA
jgi:tetratricopeptide (TPR) repeat protein